MSSTGTSDSPDSSGSTDMKPKDESEKPKGFTIYSWNINGIRSLNMKEVVEKLNSDILVLQETKIARNQLDSDTAFIGDYNSYFSFCQTKSGYSGVATYCSKGFTPVDAKEGLMDLEADRSDRPAIADAVDEYKAKAFTCDDSEGRCVITEHMVETPEGHHILLAVINVYCPRLRCDPDDPIDNTEKKIRFHDVLLRRAESYIAAGAFVLIAGDLNVSHKPIDHVEGAEGLRSSLFCSKMDDLLLKSTFKDTFRFFYPERLNAFTCWNSKTNARQNNYGTRLDYIIADDKLIKYLESAEIHPDIMGSDHCPISARFHSLVPVPSKKLSFFATKFYPELTGTQRKIHDFFQKAPKDSSTEVKPPPAKKAKSQQLKMSDYLIKKPKLDSTVTQSKHSNNTEDSPKEFEDFNYLESVFNSSASSTPTSSQEKTGTDFWKQLMKPKEVPRCSGHDEPCARKTVKKKGPTYGRQFWSCPRGVGARTDPNANCGYFKWCSS